MRLNVVFVLNIVVLVHLMISPSTLVWLHCILILAVGTGISRHFVVTILILFKLGSYYIALCVAEVEDTHHRLAFLDGGAILNLPLFYLEGTCYILYPRHCLFASMCLKKKLVIGYTESSWVTVLLVSKHIHHAVCLNK